MDLSTLFTDGKISITKEELEAWFKQNKITSLEDDKGGQKYVDVNKYIDLKTEVKELKKQLENANKVSEDYVNQIQSLKDSGISKEDMEKRISEIQNEHKSYVEQLNKEAENFKKITAIKEELHKYNVRPEAIDYIVGKLNTDIIAFNNKGEVIGIKDQIKDVVEANSFAFNAVDSQKIITPNNDVKGSGGFSSLSTDITERANQLDEIARNNPERLDDLLREAGY